MMKKKKILLFGSGYMANEYLKVLKALSCDVFIIGRNRQKVKALADSYGFKGCGGGTSGLKNVDCGDFDWVINAVPVDKLFEVTSACVQHGLSNILIEKPGALNLNELNALKKKEKKGINIRVACNRRFYGSVQALRERIKEDGGIVGCFFDFTDREKDIFEAAKGSSFVDRWGWANSMHVIDLAFHLIGLPQQIKTFRDAGWKFHPTGNVFTGSGRSEKSLFSYYSTWSGGGRWAVEISTPEGRYKLSPLEKLAFCKKNQFNWEEKEFAMEHDTQFKPGLYKMVNEVILNNRPNTLPTLDEQIRLYKVTQKIFGYEN